MTVILNRRFTASISFHDILHGFWAGLGIGTASLDAKLLQQLANIMDLHKKYAALDRDRFLEILEGYSMVSQYHQILWEYWDRLWVVDRKRGYYGEAFKGFWGVIKGDPLPHTNIVGGRGRGRAVRVGKGGVTFFRLFLCGLWPGQIDGPGLDAGGV